MGTLIDRQACRKFYKFFVILIFFAMSAQFFTSAAEVKTNPLRIAIVHSYHESFEWTQEVEKGFLGNLKKDREVSVVGTFFLDAKRFPATVDSESQRILVQLKKLNFDLLFITDDDAMKVIGRSYISGSKYLVFAGLNQPLEKYGIGKIGLSDTERDLPKRVAGVLEYYPMVSLFKLIRELFPNANTINCFFDKSETSNAVRARFESEFKSLEGGSFKFKLGSMIVSNRKTVWEKALRKSNPKESVNLIFPFSGLHDSRMKAEKFSPTDLASWMTKMTDTPEFATASLTLGLPFFATVGIRGSEHGSDAADEAKKMLSGRNPRRVGIGKYARLHFNIERARQLNVQIPFELLAYSYSLQKRNGEK